MINDNDNLNSDLAVLGRLDYCVLVFVKAAWKWEEDESVWPAARNACSADCERIEIGSQRGHPRCMLIPGGNVFARMPTGCNLITKMHFKAKCERGWLVRYCKFYCKHRRGEASVQLLFLISEHEVTSLAVIRVVVLILCGSSK